MNLTRQQILEEMGLSPQWVLRDRPRPEQAPEIHRAPESPESFEPDEGDVVSPPPMGVGVGMGAELRMPVASTQELAGSRPDDIVHMDWPRLRQAILDCRACGLCAKRKQAVPGVGDEHADWLFIGEGPGAEEDARGEPFVGQAGKLLDAMLAAIDLKRGENVYIANAVKCRPPGNRTPEAAEMAACWPYLQRQIELLRPKLIILLGKAAVSAVLGEERSLASMRGKPLMYRQGDLEIPVVVTYHPAYLLRNLPDKAKAWEDLCRSRELMRRLTTG